MRYADTLRFHLEHPEITPGSHIRSCHLALADRISGRHKIYLDTKYWLLFRDVIIGRCNDQSLVQLLDRVRNATAKLNAICPMSSDAFSEVFVQSNPETLKATVQLADELSGGVCLSEYLQRIDGEIASYLCRTYFPQGRQLELSRMAWTRAGYVLGLVSPRANGIPAAQHSALEKSLFDDFWTIGFNDLYEHLGCCPEWKVDPNSVDEMNAGKLASNGDFQTFREVVLIEFAGIVDSIKQNLVRELYRIYVAKGGESIESIGNEDSMDGTPLADRLYSDFRDGRIGDELPTIRIEATLHAALRWHRHRKYKPNDMADLRHASAAIAYCDTFLTERSLCQLVKEKHLGLSDDFRCKVFSEAHAALKHFDEIGI